MNNLNISFECNGLNHTINIPCDDNIPYNLAEAVTLLINMSMANEDIVIEQLIDNFNYTKEE